MSTSGIYEIFCLTKAKVYVGKTEKDIHTHGKAHFRLLKKNIHHNKFLQKDFNLYGISDFTLRVVEEINEINDTAYFEERETHRLSFYNNNEVYNVAKQGKNRERRIRIRRKQP